MKMKIVLAIVLAAVTSGVRAEWIRVDWNDERTFYADPASVRSSGAMVKMWEMSDFKTVQISGGKQFLSVRSQTEYDCKQMRLRRLYMTEHGANMAAGEIVRTYDSPTGWAPIPSGTASEALSKLACGLLTR